MKMKTFLLAVIFTSNPLLGAQTSQTPAPRNPARAEHRQHMMEMHQQEMEALKADLAKMKASLAAMKAHLLTIKDVNVGNVDQPHGSHAKANGIDGPGHGYAHSAIHHEARVVWVILCRSMSAS